MMDQIFGMIVTRPYVFLPLGLFFLFGTREMGWHRTLLWALVGFAIAFLAEFSSVRSGFPFGWYYYVKEPTAHREIWLTNVPLWDSISFVFLSYWSFCAARIILQQAVFNGEAKASFPWKTWVLGAFLMMLADLVIDPVALHGERWFLGVVYGYPEWGIYFGVPLANFVGWFLVGLAIMGSMLFLERRFLFRFHEPKHETLPKLSSLLYVSVVLFNSMITLAIQEYKLFISGLCLTLPVYLLILYRQGIILPRLRPLRIR
jgi:putative membrane protein